MGLFKARMGGPWGSLSSGWHSRQGWSLGSLPAQTFLWFSDIHMCPCMIQYLLLFKLKSERTASSRESRCIYRFTDVSLSWQMLGLSEMSSLFCLGFFFFFKSPSLLEMKSLSEVTSGHGNHLEALLDFCLMSIPGVLQHSLLCTYFCLWRHPKQNPVIPFLPFGHWNHSDSLQQACCSSGLNAALEETQHPHSKKSQTNLPLLPPP